MFGLLERESLSVCACSPESRQGSPEQAARDASGLEALAQLASPASSGRPQTLGGRSQASALAQLADVEGSSWGPRGSAHAPSKYGSFSADLDFDEFLDRQQRFLQVCSFAQSCISPCQFQVTGPAFQPCPFSVTPLSVPDNRDRF